MKRYGPGWRLFSATIKVGRAAGHCECTGHCGKHRFKRCNELHGRPAAYAKGRVVLTTAHLCTCDPPCTIPNHVLAMCQACHLRTDIALHLAHRRAKREGKPPKRPLAFPLSDAFDFLDPYPY